MSEVKKSTKAAKAVKKEEVENVEEIKIDESNVDFKGKYIQAIGRRKTAIARVRLYENGKGAIVINGTKASKYFPGDGVSMISQPLKLTGKQRDYNISVITKGGGKSGQLEAVRHGISRALVKIDEGYRALLKTSDLLTRDKREKERKKPGLKKARKAPQWSKR